MNNPDAMKLWKYFMKFKCGACGKQGHLTRTCDLCYNIAQALESDKKALGIFRMLVADLKKEDSTKYMNSNEQ